MTGRRTPPNKSAQDLCLVCVCVCRDADGNWRSTCSIFPGQGIVRPKRNVASKETGTALQPIQTARTWARKRFLFSQKAANKAVVQDVCNYFPIADRYVGFTFSSNCCNNNSSLALHNFPDDQALFLFHMPKVQKRFQCSAKVNLLAQRTPS